MNTAQRILPLVMLLFGALLIGGRIHREIVSQVCAEERRVDASIHQLRESIRERALGFPRTLTCGVGQNLHADELEPKALREKCEQLLREFDERFKTETR